MSIREISPRAKSNVLEVLPVTYSHFPNYHINSQKLASFQILNSLFTRLSQLNKMYSGWAYNLHILTCQAHPALVKWGPVVGPSFSMFGSLLLG